MRSRTCLLTEYWHDKLLYNISCPNISGARLDANDNKSQYEKLNDIII